MARAVQAAFDVRADGETFFVGHPAPVSACDVIHTIGDVLGRRGVVVPVPAALVRAAGRVGDVVGTWTGRPALLNQWRTRELFAEGFVCSVDRLRDRLGVTAQVNLHDGLARTARWYTAEGWL